MWVNDAFFGLHYDLHPNANDTELGRLRKQTRSQKSKPDWR
jgi:hypothetical protein